ncbi:hypothetical protein ABE426_03670 [Sphingobacterium faecium]|jgi:hypothetical protein
MKNPNAGILIPMLQRTVPLRFLTAVDNRLQYGASQINFVSYASKKWFRN